MEAQPVRTHVARDQGDTITLEPRDQGDRRRHKPLGFWYEVDGDWRRWCNDEDWGLKGDEVIYDVELRDVNLLCLSNADAIVRFTDTFGIPDAQLDLDFDYVWQVDWPRVAQEWDGIEIAPYQWDLRLDMYVSWYYSWDCASGVIWQPRNTQVTRQVMAESQ